MSNSVWRRLPMPLTLLVGGVLLSGCSGEENIPLQKVQMIQEVPKDFKETRKGFTPGPGSSAKIGHDPSGVSKN